MKLRVGFDARWYNDSGVGTYVSELLRTLALHHREEIELYVYENPGNPLPSLLGLEVKRVPVYAGKYSAREQIEMAKRTHVDKLNLFHSPFFVIPLLARCPVVVTIHDLIPFLFPIYSAVKEIVVKTSYQLAAFKAAHVIADSESTAQDVERLLKVSPQKIKAVPIAADTLHYTPDAKENEVSLLREKYGVTGPYVMAASASNWQHKNLEGALMALEFATTELGVKFQTMVYGPKPGIEAAGGIERWQTIALHHTGYTAIDDLAMLFRHARAFIMPSLYEGFGLPILEAMSCGCPVITSHGGSLTEVAGDGAQIFDPNDAPAMAGAVARLVTQEENFQQWRAAALRQAKRFSWERTARETLNVYRKVYDARRRNPPVIPL